MNNHSAGNIIMNNQKNGNQRYHQIFMVGCLLQLCLISVACNRVGTPEPLGDLTPIVEIPVAASDLESPQSPAEAVATAAARSTAAALTDGVDTPAPATAVVVDVTPGAADAAAVFVPITPVPVEDGAENEFGHLYGPGWLHTYVGVIDDKYPVMMTLTFNGNAIKGVYFYNRYMVDIRLEGERLPGRDFVLREYDESGQLTARFEGRFPEIDPRGYFSSKLGQEVMTGTWYAENGAAEYSFYLHLGHSTAGTLENRYALIEVVDDAAFEAAVGEFRQAVIEDDRNTVVNSMNYPLRVNGPGDSQMFAGPEELLAAYDQVFTPGLVAAITAAVPRYLFVKSSGAMLGAGEVWFWGDGKVIAINNTYP